MTLVERLRMHRDPLNREAVARIEALEKELREIATQCEHMAAAELFDPDWVIAIARKALGEEKP